MVEMGGAMGVVVAALAVVLVPWLWAALVNLVWRPHAVARAFARQGIRGPPYRFFLGNTGEAKEMRAAASVEPLPRSSHDIVPRVMPHLRAWASLYGKVFLWWKDSFPMLCLGNYDMVRLVLSDKAGLYVKPDPTPVFLSLMGMGLVFAEGDEWARHRRVVHPAFAMEKLKRMTPAMAACAGEVVRAWEARAAAAEGRAVTVEVGRQFMELTADVISHTAFGSSYRQGKEVFLAQRELQFIAFASMNSVRVPGTRYVPTKANVRRWRLERKVRGTLMGIIDGRLAAAKEARGYGTDLLGLMLEANAGDGGGQSGVMSMDDIIDECKTFFFAGHDTTAHLLTWAVFLLGTHPEWQQRLREEVLHECGGAEVPLHGDQQAQAGDDGAVRDAEAVRPGQQHREAGGGGRGPLRREGAQGHLPVGTVRAASPRRGGVGRGRRRVQPAPVPGRRGQGGRAPERAADLLLGPKVVHRPGLRDAGGKGDAGAHPEAVHVRGGAGVRARADRVPDAAAPARAPGRAQALGFVGAYTWLAGLVLCTLAERCWRSFL